MSSRIFVLPRAIAVSTLCSAAAAAGAVLLMMLATGCFDSLVSDRCASGYQLVDGRCAARPAGDDPDADVVPPHGDAPDAPAFDAPDGALPMCTEPLVACDTGCKDLSSDSDNCGACGRVCASGICTDGHCIGDLPGHVVAIGHDFTSHDAAMARVLGNACALAAHEDVGVARWHGTSSAGAVAGATASLAQAMSAMGRPWHAAPLGAQPGDAAFAGVDCVIVDAQTGDGDATATAAAPWAAPLDRFVRHGGIVVVLEGAGGTSWRLAAAADLYTVAAPTDASGLPASIVDPADALAQQVLSPYLAQTSSVAYDHAAGEVIATSAGTLVFHATRY